MSTKHVMQVKRWDKIHLAKEDHVDCAVPLLTFTHGFHPFSHYQEVTLAFQTCLASLPTHWDTDRRNAAWRKEADITGVPSGSVPAVEMNLPMNLEIVRNRSSSVDLSNSMSW